MEFLTHSLHRHERNDFTNHLLALDAEDRRLRFATPRSDEAIREYADGIDFGRDAVMGVYDDELKLLGAAHVARGPGYAEVGVSVLAGHRGRGIGNALLARGRLHARNWGLAELFTHCAADNRAMMQLAKKHGMRAMIESGEADAFLAVPAPDPGSFAAEMLAERVGVLDHALKKQCLGMRRAAESLRLLLVDDPEQRIEVLGAVENVAA